MNKREEYDYIQNKIDAAKQIKNQLFSLAFKDLGEFYKRHNKFYYAYYYVYFDEIAEIYTIINSPIVEKLTPDFILTARKYLYAGNGRPVFLLFIAPNDVGCSVKCFLDDELLNRFTVWTYDRGKFYQNHPLTLITDITKEETAASALISYKIMAN